MIGFSAVYKYFRLEDQTNKKARICHMAELKNTGEFKDQTAKRNRALQKARSPTNWEMRNGSLIGTKVREDEVSSLGS